MADAVEEKALAVDESLDVDKVDSKVCESHPGNLEVKVDHGNLVEGRVDPLADEACLDNLETVEMSRIESDGDAPGIDDNKNSKLDHAHSNNGYWTEDVKNKTENYGNESEIIWMRVKIIVILF